MSASESAKPDEKTPKVRCPHNSGRGIDCPWSGESKDVAQHLETACHYVQVECPFAKFGCTQLSGERWAITEHGHSNAAEHLALILPHVEKLEVRVAQLSERLEQLSKRTAFLFEGPTGPAPSPFSTVPIGGPRGWSETGPRAFPQGPTGDNHPFQFLPTLPPVRY
jgi:hypothetical protein